MEKGKAYWLEKAIRLRREREVEKAYLREITRSLAGGRVFLGRSTTKSPRLERGSGYPCWFGKRTGLLRRALRIGSLLR